MKLMNTRANGLSILVASLVLTGISFWICYNVNYWKDLTFHYCSTLTTDVTPSFILLAIQGSKVVTYVYELHGEQVRDHFIVASYFCLIILHVSGRCFEERIFKSVVNISTVLVY